MVITLAALLLISAILLVFFDQSTLNRQISFSSAGQYRADMVARTALDTIVGDLRNEIYYGSTNSNAGTSITNYFPANNQTIEPAQSDKQGFTNLVAQSGATTNLWPAANYTAQGPDRSAPGNNTEIASFNGHFIDKSRWNKPGLLGDPGTGPSPTVPTGPNGAYLPPDWVLITRSGAVTNEATLPPIGPNTAGSGTLSDKSTANLNYVVGRYAYTIYNEGGLLDVNVAGAPQIAIGTDVVSKRGMLPQIDLSNLLRDPAIGESSTQAQTDAQALISWRNFGSSSSFANYTNLVLGATNGFTTVLDPKDQSFVSRQDLINFIKNKVKNTNIPTAALPFLTTFTRELNAPSYSPPPLGNTARPPEQAGEGIKLMSGVTETEDQFNPSLINTRVTKPFKRFSDNTTAQIGEPLLKYRFPLSRLDWIRYNGPAPGISNAQIMSAFGLTWNGANGNWTYGHTNESDSSKIDTLDEVANLTSPREPDFFELLQAGMFVGSLGKSAFTTFSPVINSLDSNTYYQVIQIGANLIDQYDTDSYPTRIIFDAANHANYEFDGVESLPYISRIWEACQGSGGNPTPTTSSTGTYGIWYIPEVWNPCSTTEQAIAPPGPSPTHFRYTVNGTMQVPGQTRADFPFHDNTYGSRDLSPPQNFPVASQPPPSATLPTTENDGIDFKLPAGQFNAFQYPLILQPNSSATAGQGIPQISATAAGVNSRTSVNGPFIGICAGIKTATVPNPFLYANNTQPGAFVSSIAITHQLWYLDAGGRWVSYSRVRSINGSVGGGGALSGTNYNSPNLFVYEERSDPRTDRFGVVGLGIGNAQDTIPTGTRPDHATRIAMRPGVAPDTLAWVGVNNGPSFGWTYIHYPTAGPADPLYQESYSPYLLSENLPTSPTRYKDPDGVQRRADGAYVGGITPIFGGYPVAVDPANVSITQSRPVILNRPFRSVADMGYAFRDEPWKHIDFFTAQSADAALLDLFCLNESPQPPSSSSLPTTDPVPPPVPAVAEAGRIDLNTQQLPVLRAILGGAIKRDEVPTSLLSAGIPSDADKLATSLVNLTKTTPLLNRSELVTRWISTISTSLLATQPETTIKRQREAAVRALADVGNTRTWNLLIDVIAQSGRYLATAGAPADLNKQFVVEGERRYWLHVAIDRYTGKVIAESLEPVYE